MSAPAVAPPASPVARGLSALRAGLGRFGGSTSRASAWRTRAPLIAVLSVALLGGLAVLVTYRGFYDVRFQALETTRAELQTHRDEVEAAAQRVQATEVRLRDLQRELDTFNKDVLGTRKERLAALIEDVYALTQKAGLVPAQIGYGFDDASGADRLALSFAVQGRYADVKKLLFSFENNPRFLLLESVAVSTDDSQPDVLRLNLVVAHYFRTETPGGRAARPGVSRSGVVRTPSAGAKTTPASGVPE